MRLIVADALGETFVVWMVSVLLLANFIDVIGVAIGPRLD